MATFSSSSSSVMCWCLRWTDGWRYAFQSPPLQSPFLLLLAPDHWSGDSLHELPCENTELVSPAADVRSVEGLGLLKENIIYRAQVISRMVEASGWKLWATCSKPAKTKCRKVVFFMVWSRWASKQAGWGMWGMDQQERERGGGRLGTWWGRPWVPHGLKSKLSFKTCSRLDVNVSVALCCHRQDELLRPKCSDWPQLWKGVLLNSKCPWQEFDRPTIWAQKQPSVKSFWSGNEKYPSSVDSFWMMVQICATASQQSVGLRRV